MSLIALVEKTIAVLKKDPSYRFKTDYTSRQLFIILFARGMQIIRGLRVKFWTKSQGLVFCGRSVVIEHGYMIRSGPNLILEDNVSINALSENGIKFGRNVTLSKGIIIACTGVVAHKGVGLVIGDYSGINAQSYIGCQGGVTVGANVIMGPGVRIFSENHNFTHTEVPIRLQGEIRQEVVIEDDCWIGSGATILAGVRIGTGSVIAAGSIVTNDVLPYSVVAGIPARLLKTRKQ
jgi:acetyltransferase-like isoleucine patch superfamily enzyme